MSLKEFYSIQHKIVFWLTILSAVNFAFSKTVQNETSNAIAEKDTSDLTDLQKEALTKLRQQVLHQIERDYMKEDFYLRRWLEAKEWNVVDAELMLTQNLVWRKQNRMDTISNENWTDMIREYPYTIDTVDKLGRPVATISVKKWDIRRAASQGRVPRLQRYMFKMLEELTNKLYEARAQGKNVTQWSAIINAEGFGLFQHACPSCVPVWLNFVRSAADRYPGYADSIALINVPRPLVRILRPIFTSEHLKLFGSEKNTWMKYLDSFIDKEQRTAEFGGTKVKGK